MVKSKNYSILLQDELRERERLEAQREEEKKALEGLKAESEELRAKRGEEKAELERLRVERDAKEAEVERVRAEAEKSAAEVIKKAEADRLRLEEEVLKIRQEKLALEGLQLNAEKAIKERDERLEEMTALIKVKEAEIQQKEQELKSCFAAATAAAAAAAAGQEEGDDLALYVPEVKLEVEVEAESEAGIVEEEPLNPEGEMTQFERETVSKDSYWFTPPSSFSESKKHIPSDREMKEILTIVPEFVARSIMSAMPESVLTGMPKLAFLYNQSGRLPNWTVVWFIRALRSINSRASDESLFFKAMHLIEALRERIIYGCPDEPDII